jgi:hypothetical protein
MSLPEFLGRGNIAIEDFEYLAVMMKQDPSAYLSIKKEVYENLAKLYEKNGNKQKAETFRVLAGKN